MNWPIVPMEAVMSGFFDGPHATPGPCDEGPVFLGIKNLTDDGHLDLSDIRHISEAEFPRWTKRVTPAAGDIVFTYEATLNRYAIVPAGFRGCLGRRMALIRPNSDRVDTRFLHYSFFSPEWRQTIAKHTVTGSTVDRIPLKRFPTFPLRLPPLPTQRRIAGILSAYDDLIENNTKRIKILEDMAQALFYRAKAAGGDCSVKRELGDISDEVGGTIRTGPFGSALHKRDYTEYGTPVVMPKDLVEGRVSESTIARVPDEIVERLAQHILHEGDIVYGRRGDIGRRGYIGARNSGWLCGTGCLRISLPSGVLSTRYLHEYLGQPEVIALIAGRAVGSTMPNLNTKILRSIPVLVPPEGVQREFDEAVCAIDALRDNLLDQLDNLRKTRDLLLPRLVSGKIDVDALHLPEAAQ